MSLAMKKNPLLSPPSDVRSDQKVDMKYLIRALVKYNASDLHLKAGRPPLYRINGKLIPAKMDILGAKQIEQVLTGLLTPKHWQDLEKNLYADFSFGFEEIGRFRCNVYFQRSTLGAAIRMIPLTVPTLDELGLPSVVKDLCFRQRGLVLVTGATGSGKSTTLAAMVHHINQNRYVHVLSLEDPIEFLHRDEKGSITQREIGSDIRNFREALYVGLRQDPDVIVIGELRENEVIETALLAAETGHLVISTLHTNDCKSTIQRITDVFPGDRQNQVRVQLASALVGVVSQRLLVRADGSGRVPTCEVMVKSPAIENYIRKSDLNSIQDAIASSTTYYKMQTFNQDLERLIKVGEITVEEALKASSTPEDLKLRLSGVSKDQDFQLATESETNTYSRDRE